MKNKLIECLIGIITTVISWLSLSYVFFPIKLSATGYEYFTATVTHMVPLKSFITILFVLFAIFIYEQKIKKSKKD